MADSNCQLDRDLVKLILSIDKKNLLYMVNMQIVLV